MPLPRPHVKRRRLGDPCVTAGDRCYAYGSQDGDFPDLGRHVPGEMGGVWAHPIKLLDGFWLHLEEAGAGGWLTPAAAFVAGPFWVEHRYERPGLRVRRRQFAPDGAPGLIICVTLQETSGRARQLDLSLVVRSDLRPVWLGERVGMADGPDAGEITAGQFFLARDGDWAVCCGAAAVPLAATCGPGVLGPHATAGQGVGGRLTYRLRLPAGGRRTLVLAVAGSTAGTAAAADLCRDLLRRHRSLWRAKQQRNARLAAAGALSLPDRAVERACHWLPFSNDWLVCTVPGLGTGLAAGLPEYPWWFGCDSTYALFGLLAAGQPALAQATLRLLAGVSAAHNGDGRIIHEVSTGGAVFNPGNTQETAHFIKAVYHTVLWSGDAGFAREMLPQCRAGLRWLLAVMDGDGDLLPSGYGIMEVPGLNCELLDTAVYTWEALRGAAYLARLCGEPGAAEWEATAERLERRIEAAFWLEAEGLYGDMVASPAALRARLPEIRKDLRGSPAGLAYLDALAGQAAALAPAAERAWFLGNWITLCPLEAGLAPPERAARVLARLATPEFSGPWGVYINSLCAGAAMTISTGVAAVAAAAYGRPDAALRHVRCIAGAAFLRTPGAASEMAPDGGCAVQAWSGYGLLWPVVRHFLGVDPDAPRRKVVLRPHPPARWRRWHLRDLPLGDARLSWEARPLPGGQEYRVDLTGAGWVAEVCLPVPRRAAVDLPPAASSVQRDDDGVRVVLPAGAHRIAVRVTGRRGR